MMEPKHHRNDFLIERIAFFSDAVFAIAITLMAIEIHPPKVHSGDTAEMVWHKFRELLPEFLGLLVSFWLIASIWLRHHSLFKYMDNYDLKFMVINMWLLFMIILFPFSTSFLFNSLFEKGISKLQVVLYLGVPFFANLILLFLYWRVKKIHMEGAEDLRFKRSLFSHKAMLLSFLLALLWVIIATLEIHYFGYLFLYAGPLIIRLNKKKFIPIHAQQNDSPADN